jgi:hypothetical protein
MMQTPSDQRSRHPQRSTSEERATAGVAVPLWLFAALVAEIELFLWVFLRAYPS